ncbi:GNAT family N-acetyltransferase [bacterium]|nr:GNAT family N-acetyltransferase [bacterium]
MKLFSRQSLRFYRRSCFPVVLLTGNPSYTILGADDFPWDAHPLQEFLGVYRERFARGDRALLGHDNGAIVFSAWICSGTLEIDELNYTWHIPEGDAVAYDCITMSEHRGKGIYTAALRRVSGLLAEEGVQHLWIYVDEANTASRRGIEHADFEYHGSITSRRILGRVSLEGSVPGVNA